MLPYGSDARRRRHAPRVGRIDHAAGLRDRRDREDVGAVILHEAIDERVAQAILAREEDELPDQLTREHLEHEQMAGGLHADPGGIVLDADDIAHPLSGRVEYAQRARRAE